MELDAKSGQDRRELQDLIERRVRAGGFGIAEDVVHINSGLRLKCALIASKPYSPNWW